jgi:dephospho-CoA kinase
MKCNCEGIPSAGTGHRLGKSLEERLYRFYQLMAKNDARGTARSLPITASGRRRSSMRGSRLVAFGCNPRCVRAVPTYAAPAVRPGVTASESPRHVRSGDPYLPGSEGRVVIGVSGPIAAGKTTVCRYLEHKGFSYARFSAVIDEMLRQAGLPIDRPHQQAMGEQVNRSPGQRWLCQELMKRIPEDAGEVVIDGLRFPEDHSFLVERFGTRFLHLHVSVPRDTREKRYIHVGGTAEDFQAAERASTESKHDRMAALAHVIVANGANLTHLWRRVDRIIRAARPDLGGLLCR